MESLTINVRMPKAVLTWLDEQVELGIYKSRSEAIRDYIRNYIKEPNNDTR